MYSKWKVRLHTSFWMLTLFFGNWAVLKIGDEKQTLGN